MYLIKYLIPSISFCYSALISQTIIRTQVLKHETGSETDFEKQNKFVSIPPQDGVKRITKRVGELRESHLGLTE